MNLVGQTKSNISRTASVLGAVGLSAIALFGITKPANAASVALGSDYFVTHSQSSFNFPGIGPVNFTGNPIGTFQGVNVGQADTIIQRTQDVNLSSGSGITNINVAALSLKSTAPVSYAGSNYNLLVGLTPNVASTGTLTMNSNGTFSDSFTVNFTVAFQPQGSSTSIPCPVGSCNFSTVFATNSGKWSSTFQGGTRVEGPLGNQLANVHTNLPAGFQDFYVVGPVDHDASGAGHHVVGPTLPVPEPVSTMFGSILAFGVGAGLKNAYAKKRKNNLKAS